LVARANTQGITRVASEPGEKGLPACGLGSMPPLRQTVGDKLSLLVVPYEDDDLVFMRSLLILPFE
jgi:hypothetical protein